MHRSIWFHSITAGFTFEFLLRLGFKIIETVIEHLPVNHRHLWDRLAEFISRNKNMTIVALLVVGLSTEFHKSIMGANGLASALIGVSNLKNNYKV